MNNQPNVTKKIECAFCHKHTTTHEAEQRNFNTGKCAYCGGDLILLPVNRQSDETRLTGEFIDELEVEFLHGVPVKLPEQTKQQILSWHETEKQKYAMAYANEIIGGNDDIKSMPYTGDSNNSLRNRQRELNKSKGGKI